MKNHFKLIYDDFQQETINYRKRLNSTELIGSELIDFLNEEMMTYTNWRINYMRILGIYGRTMCETEREANRNYILNSEACRLFQESPFCRQIVQRPQGYVGDAEMMEIIYSPQYIGNTPWGMLVHKEATLYKACQAVRNRKQYLKEKIYESKENSNILSMAAGSAKEIREYLEENKDDVKKFLALDHDLKTLNKFSYWDSRMEYALANAFSFIKDKNKIAFPKQKHLLNNSLDPKTDFKGINILKTFYKYKFGSLKKDSYDLIYSAGLFDYINNFESHNKGAKKLTTFLFDKVTTGGTLIIGNFNDSIPPDEYFSMEFLTNWILFYRSDKQLLSFAEGIDEKQIDNIKIEKESTGINSFLVINKK